MNLPKVTIGIPTYNQEKYIECTVKSALNQTYTNIEIVISDDSNSDLTKKILQPYIIDSRIKYFKNTESNGRVKNYRKILYEYATGDWYVNLDGDDIFCDPDFIKNAIHHISHIQGVVLFYQAKHKEIKREDIRNVIQQESTLPQIINSVHYFFNEGSNYFSHMATLYKREIALQCNFYNLDVLVADFYSIMKMCAIMNGTVILDNKIIGLWVNHPENASKSLDYKDNFNNIKCINRLSLIASNNDNFEKRKIKQWRRKMLLKWIYIFRFKSQDLLFQKKISHFSKNEIKKRVKEFSNGCNEMFGDVLRTPEAIKLKMKLQTRFLLKSIMRIFRHRI